MKRRHWAILRTGDGVVKYLPSKCYDGHERLSEGAFNLAEETRATGDVGLDSRTVNPQAEVGEWTRIWRAISSPAWLVLGMGLVVFAVYQMKPLGDPDTPWHVATGLYILHHHQVPATDPFSWTAKGQPWVTQEWLFETILAWLEVHLGFTGDWLWMVAIGTSTMLVLYRLGIRTGQGNRLMAALTASVGVFAGLLYWTMRPQIYSYLMFAVFFYILQRVREGHLRALYAVPPLMWVWANMHGSSAIGIVMLLLEWLISFLPSIARFQGLRLPPGARWRLLAAAVVGTFAGLVNPNGIKAYTYDLLAVNPLMTDNIMEWHSPDFHSQAYQYGVLPFLILSFTILLIRYRPLPLRETLYFGGTFAATLIHQRFLPYMAIASAPLLVQVTHDWVRGLLVPSRFLRTFDTVVLAGFISFLGYSLPTVAGPLNEHWDTRAYPIGAVTYMQQHHLTHRVLNAYHWGGYLIYRGIPTFVDGRTDLYIRNGIFSNYLAIKNLWWDGPSILNSYHFDVAVFPSGYSIVTFLEQMPNWKVVYTGTNAVVLQRIPTSVG